ncbi:MAG: serine protease, partial [Candidatus Electrothrix sp. ATG2]|nr:serine protease [Candidatus Electrothrix sp. ATG2]
MRFVILYLIAISIFATEAMGSDAYVLAEEEFGQGFFRSRGVECFFITAGHVVADAAEVELITSGRRKFTASLNTIYPDDVAILRVELSKDMRCPKGSWGAGEKLKTLLTMEQDGVIKKRLNDGSILQTKVTIKTYDDIRYIQITPKDSNVHFSKGFSGSPLYVAGKPAGMLLSVANGIGKVFRQDALNNTVSLFFDFEQSKTKVSTNSREAKHSKKIYSVSPSPIIFDGSLAKGSTAMHKIEGNTNTPLIIINPAPTNGLRHSLQILDSRKKVLAKYGHNYGNERKIPFTPPKD